MNISEAFYWASMVQMARDEKDEEAVALLEKENSARAEKGMKTIQEELDELLANAKK